jgi:hypothetical protein
VPGGRNGQEFGEAFDDAQYGGFEQIDMGRDEIHGVLQRIVRAGCARFWRNAVIQATKKGVTGHQFA